MVRQAEGQFEGPLGDALVQISDAFVHVTFTAATDGQHTFFHLQLQVVFLEAGGRYDDAVLVVAVFFHVVRWVGAAWLVAQGGFEQVIETVEANRGTEQWCHGKCSTHDSNLLKTDQQVFLSPRPGFGIA
ncbi:hypothetical protein D3C84_755550 [compost metagenome]